MESNKSQRHIHHKKGQNTAEYLLMLTLLVVGSIAIMTAFGKTIQTKFNTIAVAISGETESLDDARKLSQRAVGASKTAAENPLRVSGISKEELELELR